MNHFSAARGIPPLAGVCTFEDAQRTALSVEACVTWLKRHHYLLVRLHECFTARITAEPIYELKTAFSLHAYLCAEHASAIRQRVGELREPPLGLDVVPHAALKLACDEVLSAPSHTEFVLGSYEVLIPALVRSHEKYLKTTNLLADAPSVRIARFCLMELRDILGFGVQAIQALVDASGRARLSSWQCLLNECLNQAGGVSGFEIQDRESVAKSAIGNLDSEITSEDREYDFHAQEARDRLVTGIIEPQFSLTPFRYDPIPQRDVRFHDPYNGGVNPEAFLYDERFSDRDKVLMMFYKRLREIDVPEMMASIILQTPGKPWKYYHDMSRQLWDEARHALLGEVGFIHLGVDWTKIPINFTWSKNLNTQLEPWERHAVLFFIEQGLMPRRGKRFEWETGKGSGIPLAAVIQDFDWADEVLHAQIGREWYVKEFGDLNEAMSYGDQCWSRVMSHWRSYLDSGLTEHFNWWPNLYRSVCQAWGVEPDPDALAFDITYESTRADLKGIAASS